MGKKKKYKQIGNTLCVPQTFVHRQNFDIFVKKKLFMETANEVSNELLNSKRFEHLLSEAVEKAVEDKFKSMTEMVEKTGDQCVVSPVMIPTPDGMKDVRTLKPGDVVYGPRGKFVNIPGVVPVSVDTDKTAEAKDDDSSED